MGWGPGPAGSRSCHDVAEVGPYEAVGRGPGHRQGLRRSTCSLAASQGVIQVAENAALDPLS
jgi:hypothetical protein